MKPITPAIEILESRIAPASVSGQVLSYTDTDGDQVSVTFSKGDVGFAAQTGRFHFSSGYNFMGAQQFQILDLTGQASFDGADITVKVTRVDTGDGLASIGYIKAPGLNLGKVTVTGDLGAIDAGDDTKTKPAIAALNVGSMGIYGLATQGNAGDLKSDIVGSLGSLTVQGSVKDAFIDVQNSSGTHGMIGPVTIGGSLTGGIGTSSGQVHSPGNIGAVKIGGDVQGLGYYSGSITADGNIASVFIGGSLIGSNSPGSNAPYSGAVYSKGTLGIGAVVIGHDIQGGSSNGGFGINTGLVYAQFGKIASVKIGGSLLGNADIGSGQIVSMLDLGPVIIGGNVSGGSGQYSGSIASQAGKVASVSIGGSLIGGGGASSGQVSSIQDMGPVKIGHDIMGGNGNYSGVTLSSAHLGAVSVGGSVIGGSGLRSGAIFATDIAAVTIGKDLQQGTGQDTGSIEASTGKLASITVGGFVIGGSGGTFAQISSNGDMGAVKVGASVIGGSGTNSAQINSIAGKIAMITIGGSVTGGSGGNSANLIAQTGMGPVFIGANLQQGNVVGDTGSIHVRSGNVASITIGGSVIGGAANGDDGQISTTGQMGPIKIGGDLRAGSGNVSGSILVYQGNLSSLAIGGSIIGNVSAAGNGEVNCEGNLGPVAIGGDLNGGRLYIGGAISSVKIGGSLIGSVKSDSGEISAAGNIGPVNIAGNVSGSIGARSGYIHSGNGNIASVSIGGSLIGSGFETGEISTANSFSLGPVVIGHDFQGGVSANSGYILSHKVKSITIGGSLIGGMGNNSGVIGGFGIGSALGPIKIGGDMKGASIITSSLTGSAVIIATDIASVTIGGSMISGSDFTPVGFLSYNTRISADGSLGPVTVNGSIIGNANVVFGNSPVVISAIKSIASITVGGHVDHGVFLSGYDDDLTGQNANATIGAVKVGGDWIASSIVAGVVNSGNIPVASDFSHFGDGNDHIISAIANSTSKIASITIGGVVTGTLGIGDHFGFEAHTIGSFKAAAVVMPLTAGLNLVQLVDATTTDVAIREI